MTTLDTEDLKKTIEDIHVNNDVFSPAVHESVFQRVKDYILSILSPLEAKVEELEKDVENDLSEFEGDDSTTAASALTETAPSNTLLVHHVEDTTGITENGEEVQIKAGDVALIETDSAAASETSEGEQYAPLAEASAPVADVVSNSTVANAGSDAKE